MIQVVQEGEYQLFETARKTKMLALDKHTIFAWIYTKNTGELLVISEKTHSISHLLQNGKYRVYWVRDEPKFTDLIHLELNSGNRTWQGYLLPKGLPDNQRKRTSIIATKEIITQSSNFSNFVS